MATDVAQAQTMLDPVTFEVLKNAFVTIVDQMAEQILKTCHSFVIYARDFSSALCDARGNTVTQGTQDLAAHVGTLHFTGKAIIDEFGPSLKPGDVFVMNDPYLGGTHFNDMRVIRPIFDDQGLLALVQVNGHWADVGGGAPGSFDVTAREYYGEGLRVTPVKVWDGGVFRADVARLITSNTRRPDDAEGDLWAQAEAAKLAERELLRLVDKYGSSTIRLAFDEVQDYVERLTRARISEMPDGEWQTIDYIDQDPALDEAMVPVAIKMKISGSDVYYDLSGSGPAINAFLNNAFGGTFSAVVAGTKAFFPDVPLNSGFYRALHVDMGPEGTVVNAPAPLAVTGFSAGPFDKIMNGLSEIWSEILPDRMMACSFNLEYLLVGGYDARPGRPQEAFMWYDWMAGGWGGRHGRDGATQSPMVGVGLAVQPLEGQEVLAPVRTTQHELLIDSAGPGRWRGGVGIRKGGVMLACRNTVMSYCSDRARSITWGLQGGLPSAPHGIYFQGASDDRERFLGALFSNLEIGEGDRFYRASAGGGGVGDPLLRTTEEVLADVVDAYVSCRRAALDYGVVIVDAPEVPGGYRVDEEATLVQRREIRRQRRGWLAEEPGDVARRYRAGEIDVFDAIRRYGVILDWGTGELLPETTRQFRETMHKRSAAFWSDEM